MVDRFSQQYYISRLSTPTGVCHIYQGHLIALANADIAQILDFQMYTSFGEIFEYDRKVIADALVVIHVWFQQHPEATMVAADYGTYKDFFVTTLNWILEREPNFETVSNLVDAIREMPHFNRYQGNFQDRLMRMEECMTALLCLARMY